MKFSDCLFIVHLVHRQQHCSVISYCKWFCCSCN